jgi:hypothetical protein
MLISEETSEGSVLWFIAVVQCCGSVLWFSAVVQCCGSLTNKKKKNLVIKGDFIAFYKSASF